MNRTLCLVLLLATTALAQQESYEQLLKHWDYDAKTPPDHVIVRPGFVESKEALNTQQIDVLVQQVINMRRGADLLPAEDS